MTWQFLLQYVAKCLAHINNISTNCERVKIDDCIDSNIIIVFTRFSEVMSVTISSMIVHLLPPLHQSLLQEAMPLLSQGQIHVFPKTLKSVVFLIFKLKHKPT